MKMKVTLLIAALISASWAMAQSPVATIPFEQYGDHSFIKVKVNGSPDLDFIFDTGDGLTVLDMEKAKEMDMTAGQVATTVSAEGMVSGKLVKHQELTVGGVPLHNIKVYETPLTHLEISVGRNIDGIIGYDILKSYVVSMNYDKMSIELYDPKTFAYSGTGKSFDINLTSFIPHITGTVVLQNDEKVSGEFFIDTGAKASVDFNTPFVVANGLSTKIGDSYVYLATGLGETEYEHHRGRVKSFSFGDYSFEQMPVGLSHAQHGVQNNKKIAGIIGSEILKRFNIVYDYNAKKMYWEKSGNYAKTFTLNCTGFEVQLSKDKSKVMIHRVYDEGPAKAAGIKVDSVLESVNGKKATEIGLAELRKILSQSGQSVDLVINGASVKLSLASLL